MNSIPIYQVDAFTNKLFSGNPAAVCPLDYWLPTALMQAIAAENNLAETAFYVPTANHFEIRWFTPTVEVDLCGHATLAAAHVIYQQENHDDAVIEFYSERSGKLSVTKDNSWLTLNFPTDEPKKMDLSPELAAAFEETPLEVYKGKSDYLLVYNSQESIERIEPNFAKIAAVSDCRGIIVTAPGTACDFVSRWFGPQVGVNEDPVTGSAHTTLTPFWAAKLNKNMLTAMQLSSRKGWLNCQLQGDRTLISGEAKLYLQGSIQLD